MNFKIIFFAVFSLFFAFVSCKSKKVVSDNTTETPQVPIDNWMENANEMLAGKTWKLVEVNGTKVTYSENKVKAAYIMFTESDETVTGNGSCNIFNGKYDLMKGNKIKIKDVAASKMACNSSDIEAQFMDALQLVDNYSISANSLIFHSGRSTSIAKFKVAE